MTKKIFGISLLAILAVVLIINIVQDTKEKKEAEEVQEQIMQERIKAASDTSSGVYSEGLSVGDIPPDFELKTLAGDKVKLSDLNGKKVLLNFWASWCGPCKAEMPHMEKFYQEKAEELGVEVIAVNLTSAEKTVNKQEKVENFVEEYGLNFPILLDEKGEAGNKYQIISIPTSYFINSDGVVGKQIIGPMDAEMMEKLVKDLK